MIKVGHLRWLFLMVYGTLIGSEYSLDPTASGVGKELAGEAEKAETTPGPEARLLPEK